MSRVQSVFSLIWKNLNNKYFHSESWSHEVLHIGHVLFLPSQLSMHSEWKKWTKFIICNYFYGMGVYAPNLYPNNQWDILNILCVLHPEYL